MIKVYYEVGSITIAEMTDMRIILEPFLAGLAAERRTTEDLQRMKECVTAYQRLVDNGDKKVFEKALLFHLSVANACHNPLISGFMEGLTSAYEVFYGTLDLAFEEQAKDLEFHKKCFDAIKRQDAKSAIRIMREHLEIFSPILMEHAMAEKALVGIKSKSN